MKKALIYFLVFVMFFIHPAEIIAQSGENIFSGNQENISEQNDARNNEGNNEATENTPSQDSSPIIIIPQFPDKKIENKTQTHSPEPEEASPETTSSQPTNNHEETNI